MRPGHKGALALAFVLALTLVAVAGCGNDEGKEADEGVPIELGQLEINVQLTRFLNPTDPEDKSYLVGQTVPAPTGEAYLGVFLTMKNHASEPTRLPTMAETTVVDTTGAAYEALPTTTPYAAPLGTTLAGHGEIPRFDSPAQSGPTQGSIVLFLVDESINENLPPKLEIEHDGDTGDITLDI